MATSTLKRLWKNEYFQTVVTIAIILVIVFGFWFGIQAGLNTTNPALAVASGSMLPTLNVGDLIVVQGVSPSQINAQYLTGDIVVYRSAARGGELIVHRAVATEIRNGEIWITTRGDNNPSNDAPWPSSELVGKVIGRVPYVGNLPLLTNAQGNGFIIVLIVIIVIILLVTMIPWEKKDEKGSPVPRRPFDKMGIISYVVLTVILLGIIVFSLWGMYTFYQPGAVPPEATVRGMFTDLQYHQTFINVNMTFLTQGLFTYKIDCLIDSTTVTRPGVPTLSWAQVAILALVLLNVWKLVQVWRARQPASGTA